MPFSQISGEAANWKDIEFLIIVEAKRFDKTGNIKLTIFNDIVNSIVGNKSCSLFIIKKDT